MGLRIGIDLGGTKTEAIVLDRGSQVLARRRVPTGKSYEATLTVVHDLVIGLERELGASATVGIGIPGAISPATGLVKNANATWLIGQPFDRDLSAKLNRPVRVANDADCLTLSEASDGAAAGAPVVFGVILGSGVGGGIVVNGHLIGGPNAITGEWGHNPLPWPTPEELPGPQCYCGKTGCIETFLSGRSLGRDDGRGLTGAEVAAKGDAQAEASLRRYENRLARGLAHIINILDPHVIVLGGGVSNVKRIYDTVPALWNNWVFSDKVYTKLVPPMHGDSSGVRGAAWLWGLDES
jgi:fructokinase